MAVRLERLQSHRLASTSQSAPTIGQHRSFGTRGVGVTRGWQPGGRSLVTGNRNSRLVVAATDEPEFAVFRFTLGIPGFDDALLPRVVGVLGLVLLSVNHALNDAASGPGQIRAESIGALLSGLCMLIPTLESRLQEVTPGRGRMASSAALEGSLQAFLLKDGLSESQKQELAWSSYVLLKNTNTAGMVVSNGKDVVLARGALSSAPFANGKDIAALTKVVESTGFGQVETPAYFPDKPAMGSLGAKLEEVVPAGAQCILFQGATGSSPLRIAVWSDNARAFSQRDRLWVGSIADKLAPHFQS